MSKGTVRIIDSALGDRQKEAFLRFLLTELNTITGNDCQQCVAMVRDHYAQHTLSYISIEEAAAEIAPTFTSFKDEPKRFEAALYRAYGHAFKVSDTSVPEAGASRSGATRA
jgi:hypothetical protein